MPRKRICDFINLLMDVGFECCHSQPIYCGISKSRHQRHMRTAASVSAAEAAVMTISGHDVPCAVVAPRSHGTAARTLDMHRLSHHNAIIPDDSRLRAMEQCRNASLQSRSFQKLLTARSRLILPSEPGARSVNLAAVLQQVVQPGASAETASAIC